MRVRIRFIAAFIHLLCLLLLASCINNTPEATSVMLSRESPSVWRADPYHEHGGRCNNFDGIYVCLDSVNHGGVVLYTNAITWATYPKRLIVGTVTVSGCEGTRNRNTFVINRWDWPVVRYTTNPNNGSTLLESHLPEIVVDSRGCEIVAGSVVAVEVYYVTPSGYATQEFYLRGILVD